MFHSVLARFRSARAPRPLVPPHVALARPTVEPMEPRLLMSMAQDVYAALDLPLSSLFSVVADPHPDSLVRRESVTQGGLLGFPSGPDNDFLILSTGVASQVDTLPNTSGGQGTDLGNPGVTNDVQGVEFSMDVEGGAAGRKFKFDFMFLSEEYPEFINQGFNDFFHAYVDFDGAGGDAPIDMAADQNGNPISIDSVLFSGAETTGTFFDGRTALLTASMVIPDGTTQIDVEFVIGDSGDGGYDSAVILDNVRIEASQVVYLNFTGADDFTFAGRTADVPAFDATDVGYPESQDDQAVIDAILADVRDDFVYYDIQIQTHRPTSGEYMEVVIGGDGVGTFWSKSIPFGQATSLDFGNRDKHDKAVVNSARFGPFYTSGKAAPFTTSDPAVIAATMATTISHEIGHNLGLMHVTDEDESDILNAYSPRDNDAVFQNVNIALHESSGTQNSYQVLASTLGLKDTTSALELLHMAMEHMFTWLSLILDKPMYDVQLGTYGYSEDGENDIAPQIFTFDEISGKQQVELPNFSGQDKFFLIGASKPGGPKDLTTGALDENGQIDLESALTDMVAGEEGGFLPSLEVSQVKNGQLVPYAELQLDESVFTDVDWLDKGKGVYTDADGDVYTVQFKGPGSVAVAQSDGDGDGKGHVAQIIVDGGTDKSQLAVGVKKAAGGDGVVNIDKITGDSLKSITAKASDLTGAGVTFTGFMGGLAIRHIAPGASVIAGGTAAQKFIFAAAGTVGDNVTIDVDSVISSFAAARVGDAAITAPAISKLTVKGDKLGTPGDFGADLTLTGAAGLVTLGSATIAGQMLGGNWSITGDAGTLTAGSIVGGWTGSLTGHITKKLAVNGNASMTLNARSIKQAAIKGDLDDSLINVVQVPDALNPKLQAMGALSVGGAMSGSVLRSSGHVGSVAVGRISNSSVLLGLWPALSSLPDSAGDFLTEAELGAFTVKGTNDPLDAVDFKLAAYKLGKVSLKDVQLDNGDAEFGLATTSLASLSIDFTDPALEDYKWPNSDEPLGPAGIDDLAIRLLPV